LYVAITKQDFGDGNFISADHTGWYCGVQTNSKDMIVGRIKSKVSMCRLLFQQADFPQFLS